MLKPKHYPGANGTPTNDTDPIIGAISTSAELNSNNANLLIANMMIGSVDKTYYGGAYRKNEDTISLTNARMTNRAGAIRNSAGGVAYVQSTSALDTGKVRITGKVSSLWISPPELVTCNGITAVASSNSWDANSIESWEYTLDGVSRAIPNGTITCSVNGQICATIYGLDSGNDPNGNSLAVDLCEAGYKFAVGLAKDTGYTAANRLTKPRIIGGTADGEGLTAFSAATKWNGADTSIAIPGDVLETTKYIGYAVEFISKANRPKPLGGFTYFAFGFVGEASA